MQGREAKANNMSAIIIYTHPDKQTELPWVGFKPARLQYNVASYNYNFSFPPFPLFPPDTPTLNPSDSPVILSNDTSMNTTTTPVITPDITPCESPFIYKIYTHVNYDTLALHNLETSTVEIYNWTTMVGSEGPVVERDFFTLQVTEFVQLSNGEFIFQGWTIDSELNNNYNKTSKIIRKTLGHQEVFFIPDEYGAEPNAKFPSIQVS